MRTFNQFLEQGDYELAALLIKQTGFPIGELVEWYCNEGCYLSEKELALAMESWGDFWDATKSSARTGAARGAGYAGAAGTALGAVAGGGLPGAVAGGLAGATAGGLVGGAWGGLKGGASYAWNQLGGFRGIGNAASKVASGVGNAANTVYDKAGQMANSFQNGHGKTATPAPTPVQTNTSGQTGQNLSPEIIQNVLKYLEKETGGVINAQDLIKKLEDYKSNQRASDNWSGGPSDVVD